MKAEDIKTIDFDLKIDNDTFVQTTITNVASRYKVFYCFKNGDTREDGEDRCTEDTFASITKMIADAIDNTTSEPVSISYYIKLTSHTNSSLLFNNRDASPQAIKKIIDALTEHIDELSFLNAFKRFI